MPCGDARSGPAVERDVPVSTGPPGSLQHPGTESTGEGAQPVSASGHEMYVDNTQYIHYSVLESKGLVVLESVSVPEELNTIKYTEQFG